VTVYKGLCPQILQLSYTRLVSWATLQYL